MSNKKIIIPTIIILFVAAGFFLYTQLAPIERTGATLDYQYSYVETPREDGCYDIFVYSASQPDVPLSQLESCDDRVKNIEFRYGLLSLTTKCGRRYTIDIDKQRDFYDNNFCNEGSLVGGLYTSRVTLKDILDNWSVFEKTLTVRPEYHNQEADDIWHEPTAVQDIGNNALLLRIEDDNYVHIILAKLVDQGFELIELYENHGPFTGREWAQLQKTYGNITDETVTYTTELLREDEIKNFGELTKVGENVFVDYYWVE